MLRNQNQNIQLHVLLHKQGIELDQKEDLVSQFTEGRTVRSSQMNEDECQKLIDALKSQGRPELLDRKRKRVISHLREAGFESGGRADMPAIYAWVRRQKHKKDLNELNSSQLSALIIAAKGVRDHFLKKVDHARTT